MKNTKTIKFLTAFVLSVVLLTSVVFAQAEWTVTENRPPDIGPEVAAGQRNNSIDPDATWQVSSDGLVQAIFYDHDPKCNETIGYVQVEATVMPVPTAYFRPNGSCTDPVDFLWASTIFTVAQDNLVSLEQGDSSGRFFLNFVTYTPSPTATASPTVTATATVTPTLTPTPTAIPPTVTAEPPDTAEPTQCIEAHAERQTDGSYLVYVEAINPVGYTLYDGSGYLYFNDQPITMSTLVAGVVYTVSVGTNGEQCTFQLAPTGLPTDDQPRQLDFQLVLPFMSR